MHMTCLASYQTTPARIIKRRRFLCQQSAQQWIFRSNVEWRTRAAKKCYNTTAFDLNCYCCCCNCSIWLWLLLSLLVFYCYASHSTYIRSTGNSCSGTSMRTVLGRSKPTIIIPVDFFACITHLTRALNSFHFIRSSHSDGPNCSPCTISFIAVSSFSARTAAYFTNEYGHSDWRIPFTCRRLFGCFRSSSPYYQQDWLLCASDDTFSFCCFVGWPICARDALCVH